MPRLKITQATAQPDGTLHVTCVSIIDEQSGETIRAARITPELASFLMAVEIDLSLYFEIEKMKEKNPAISKLISTFALYT